MHYHEDSTFSTTDINNKTVSDVFVAVFVAVMVVVVFVRFIYVGRGSQDSPKSTGKDQR